MTGNFRDKIQPLVNQLHDACAEADLDCVTVIRPDPYEGHDGQSLHAINLDVTMKGNVDNGRPNLRLSRSYMNVGVRYLFRQQRWSGSGTTCLKRNGIAESY